MRAWEHLTTAVGLAAALLGWGWLADTVVQRLDYGFDLEWMEGGTLLHVQRVLDGLPLYVEPSPDWIPTIYPPLYYWVVAAVSSVFGVGYTVARAVSVAGTVAAGLAAIAAVRNEGGGWGAALAASALFAVCYDDAGSFYDLVRTDGLLIGLLSWALVATRAGGLRVGGVLLALAFLAKHSAALLGLPMVLWVASWRGSREALRFAVWSAGPALFATVALQIESDGFFLKYLLGVPAAHPYVGDRLYPGAPREIAFALPWATAVVVVTAVAGGARFRRGALIRRFAEVAACGAALAGLTLWAEESGAAALRAWASGRFAGPAREVAIDLLGTPAALATGAGGILVIGLLVRAMARRGWDEGTAWWAATGGVTLVLCMVMRAHHGGFLNVLIPGLWMLSVGAGLAITSLARRLPHPSVPLVLVVVLVLQTWQGRWERERYVPTEADRAAGAALVQRLSAIEGEVFAPHFPYYPVLAGKKGSFPLIALWDIDHAGGPLEPHARQIQAAIRDERWAAVLVANRALRYGVEEAYPRTEALGFPSGALAPKAGWPVRPTTLRFPRGPKPSAPELPLRPEGD